jgi:hypothetical protein
VLQLTLCVPLSFCLICCSPPPAGNITLRFSYPVLLSALQSALAVVPCCGSNAGSSQSIKVLPCGPPYVVVDPFAPAAKQLQQQQNSTCAVVRLSPGLPASGVAILRLPKGVRYNTVSGPTKNDTDVYVSSYDCHTKRNSGM